MALYVPGTINLHTSRYQCYFAHLFGIIVTLKHNFFITQLNHVIIAVDAR